MVGIEAQGLYTWKVKKITRYYRMIQDIMNILLHESGWVMFDIDDTLITRDNEAIEDVQGILKMAKNTHHPVAIITARPYSDVNNKLTIQQLDSHGIEYDLLAFCPAQLKGDAKRELLGGKEVLMSFGDLDTDLTYSKYSFKV